MTIRIGSNIASLNAQRRLGEATSSLGATYERLASGQRINRASDDAAGLAIADDLNAKGRVYTQAIRNGNDGVSILNLADSAVDTLTGVVIRIRELSEQAANGTYSTEQRKALDAEAQALSKEFTRIAQSTSFNGVKIFDGSLGSGVRLQLGYGIAESINASIGGAIGTGSFDGGNSYAEVGKTSVAVELGDLNGDGILDLVSSGNYYDTAYHGTASVRLGTGNGNFGLATSFTMDDDTSSDIKLGDLNNDGILDLVTAGLYHDTLYGSHGTATVRLGRGDGTFGNLVTYTTEALNSTKISLADLNGDSILDAITIGQNSTTSATSIRLGAGDGSFQNSQIYNGDGEVVTDLELADFNGDGILDIATTVNYNGGSLKIRLGLGDGSFSETSSYTMESFESYALSVGDLNSDGILDAVTMGYGLSSVRFGVGDGTFSNRVELDFGGFVTNNEMVMGDINGDGNLDLAISGSNEIKIKYGMGNGNFSEVNSFSHNSSINDLTLTDLNGDLVLDLIAVGGSTPSNISVRLASTEDGLGALLDFSLKTRTTSMQAMGIMDKALENLAKQRGTIGASQSRVNIAISNLKSARENFAAAESRIRDADIASEAANLVRTQILQQAAVSVLSQANQQPQLALQLLR